MEIIQRIEDLRKAMKQAGVQAVIIPSNDAHQSEYVPSHWKSREWISGFTGSAGTVVITTEEGALFTDGRYYLQGEQELQGTGIKLHKMDNKPGPQYIRWLTEVLGSGDKVAIDYNIASIAMQHSAVKYLDPFDIELVGQDLIDQVWKDRPQLPLDPIFEHDVKYAGKNRKEKLQDIREVMKASNADHHLITTLDDIGWTFNLRGSDVEFNPVFVSYAMVSQKDATIYVDTAKVSTDIETKLRDDGIHIKDYHDIIADLNNLPEGDLILVDKNTCTIRLAKAINCEKIYGGTIPRKLKAIKNDTELAHEKAVMLKDCRALAKTFYWIEQSLKHNETITEYDVVEKLAEHRSEEALYVGESFNAIVGYRGNGAIIHYRPMPATSKKLEAEGILLCDSGGQYHDGTTDITRTFALGTPSDEEKRNFTLVLKGMIALTQARFPKGTTGGQLDTLARQFLWEEGLNFGHGTGHGVGFFMNVHEPPQGFAPPPSERGTTVHEVGMLSSNEPGYYKEGSYGIRIENLIACVEDDKVEGFLKFDTYTLYPIDLKMIDDSLMTKSEKAWLNQYHHHIWDQMEPLLDGDLKRWFELKCRPMN